MKLFRIIKKSAKKVLKIFEYRWTASVVCLGSFSFVMGLVVLYPELETVGIVPADEKSQAIYESYTRKIEVGFGNKEDRDRPSISFRAVPGIEGNTPREIETVEVEEKLGDRSIWEKTGEGVRKLLKREEKVGIEMVLVATGTIDEKGELEGKVVEQAGELLETGEEVRSGTELTEEEKEGETKQVVINREIAEEIDARYEMIEGKGVKEEIVIRKAEGYGGGCLKRISNDEFLISNQTSNSKNQAPNEQDSEIGSCSLPKNTYTFELKLDKGVQLRQSFTGTGDKRVWYFTDKYGRYIGHFLPPFAQDGKGNRTNDVRIEVIESGEWEVESSTVYGNNDIINGNGKSQATEVGDSGWRMDDREKDDNIIKANKRTSRFREIESLSTGTEASRTDLSNVQTVSYGREVWTSQSVQTSSSIDSFEYSGKSGSERLERQDELFVYKQGFSLRSLGSFGNRLFSKIYNFGTKRFTPIKTVFASETTEQLNQLPQASGVEDGKDLLSTIHHPLSTTYTLTVTVDLQWLLSPDRVYPITIDPSIVHDTEAEFLQGTENRVEVTSDPKVQLTYHELPADEHTVGLWHMNETAWSGVANEVVDFSGNGNHGVRAGNATTTSTNARLGGYCGTFDGAGDYVNCGDSDDLEGFNSLTLEAWVNPDSLAAQRFIVGKESIYKIDINTDGTVRFLTGNNWAGSILTSDIAIKINEWTHIVATYDGTTKRIYINGQQDNNSVSTSGGVGTNSTIVSIGIYSGANDPFSGLIDEVRIANRALTPGEIRAHAKHRPYGIYTSDVLDLTSDLQTIDSLGWTEHFGGSESPVTEEGLVGWWHMNNDWTDSSVYGNDGTATGATFTTSSKLGSHAGSFDGTGDYIDCGNDASLKFGTGDLTFEMWFKIPTSQTTVYPVLISKGTYNTTGGYLFYIVENKFRVYLDDTGPVNGNTNLNNDEWHYGVITKNGDNITLYLDGIVDGSGTMSNVDITSDLHVGIGARALPMPEQYLNGTIDEVRIYSRALSASEILSNYQAGNIEFQTRSGADISPDDGSWEEWKPVTSETLIESMDDDMKNWELAGVASIPGIPVSTVDANPTTPSGPTGCSSSSPVVINNLGNDDDLTNYQVKLEVEYLTGMSANFADLRFTNDAGTDLDHWIETHTASSKATVWIEIDSISGNTSELIYMWYDSCTGGNSSNADNTLLFFDDFLGSSLNLGKWTVDSGVSYSVGSSKLTVTDGRNYSWGGWEGIHAPISNLQGIRLEAKGVTWSHVSTDLFRWGAVLGSGGNSNLGMRIDDAHGSYSEGYLNYFYDTSTLGKGNIEGQQPVNLAAQRDQDGNVEFFKNEILQGTATGSNSIDTIMLVVNQYRTYAYPTTEIDRVLIRKYTNPEPTANVIRKSIRPYTEGTGSMKIQQGAPQVDSSTVALWHFDETNGDLAGNDVFDETVNNNNGELNGTAPGPEPVEGIFGKAREFNGTDDYININSVVSDVSSDTVGTFSFWVKFDDVTAVEMLLYFGDTNADERLGVETTASGKLRFVATDAGTMQFLLNTDNVVFSNDVWTHVTIVQDGTEPVIYVNGVKPTQTFSISTDKTSWFYELAGIDNARIGDRNYTSGGETYHFNGLIDEVKISNVARTPEEIAEAYRMGRDHRLSRTITSTDLSSKTKLPFWLAGDRSGTYLEATIGESAYANYLSDANTVGLWHLEEDSGYCDSTETGCVKDSSSLGNDGTPSSAPYTVQGKVGKGREFDGTDDYIAVADSTSLRLTSTGTIELWVKPDSTIQDTYAGLVSKAVGGAAANISYHFHWRQGANVFRAGISDGSNLNEIDMPLLSDTNWHHLVFIWDGSYLRLYKDGVSATTPVSQTLNAQSNSGHPVHIGGYTFEGSASGIQEFNGTIDEVRISNIARSAEDIRQAYEIGRRTHPITIDFSASLDSSNLITNSSDLSFTVDATAYGFEDKGDNLYKGDKLIVKENYGGTEYIAQGDVTAITVSTGAVTIDVWDASSSFPTSGYTANASVFKWQREWFDVTAPLSSHINATTNITLRVADGSEGRTFWLDDFKSGGAYDTLSPVDLTARYPSPERYFQYRAIFSTTDTVETPWLSDVTVNYTSGPALNQLMRHGKYFSGGVKQPYWWAR